MGRVLCVPCVLCPTGPTGGLRTHLTRCSRRYAALQDTATELRGRLTLAQASARRLEQEVTAKEGEIAHARRASSAAAADGRERELCYRMLADELRLAEHQADGARRAAGTRAEEASAAHAQVQAPVEPTIVPVLPSPLYLSYLPLEPTIVPPRLSYLPSFASYLPPSYRPPCFLPRPFLPTGHLPTCHDPSFLPASFLPATWPT